VDSAVAETISSRSDVVSGGDTLLRLKLTPASATSGDVSVVAGGTEVSSSLKPTSDGALLGLVEGLPEGASTIEVKRKADNSSLAKLTVVNHSLNGPIFAGPHSAVFGCETTAWGLDAATGPDCVAPTKVAYKYRSNDGTFKAYPISGPAPSDVATATVNGKPVDYVMRVETGVIDRAVYQIAFLNKPGQPVPTPATAASYGQWNQRLVYTFGGGCGGGFHQGASNGGIDGSTGASFDFIAKGYAIATASANVGANQCNDVRSAEVASMVKEHFIETYGVPLFTMGWGGSGGAMQQHLIATNYPGILDGIMPSAGGYRDVITEVNSTIDCSSIKKYFASTGLAWTDDQKQSVVGWAKASACDAAAGDVNTGIGGLGRIMINPTLGCNYSIGAGTAIGTPVVPSVFDPLNNPTGARCTYQDQFVNVFGKDPATGFARRPFDNVGVQYGLQALKDGKISADQFIDLNQRAGGYDVNGNSVSERMVGDPTAVGIAYTTGRIPDGVQLGSTPIISVHSYGDLAGGFGSMHDFVQNYISRARMIRANGNANNQIILVMNGGDFATAASFAVEQMDKWLTALRADSSTKAPASKVRTNKPADLTDACWIAGSKVIQTSEDGISPSTCTSAFPYHSDPRLAAGMPLTNDILKCALKPLDAADYGNALTPAQFTTLQSIFPQGVCDFTRPGQGQAKVTTTWARY